MAIIVFYIKLTVVQLQLDARLLLCDELCKDDKGQIIT